jgi:hypothetical protein
MKMIIKIQSTARQEFSMRIAVSTCAFASLLSACSPSENASSPGCVLTDLPSAYESPAYDSNTAVERDLRTRFKAFLQPMRDAEANLAVKPTEAELRGLFEAGTPSLRSLTSDYYRPKVDALITAFAAAAGNTWAPQSPPSGPGGKYGAYLFTADGTDLRQAIEKGMFAAAFYRHGFSLTSDSITTATVDRLIASFGAHASFPADTAAAQNPDEFAAAYAKRRDKRDPQNPGVYLGFKSDAIKARAAIQAGGPCVGQRDEALRSLRISWERALLATAVYYFNDASKKIGAAAPTTADMAAGLHSYGEAVGFIHGFRSLPPESRIITDSQIDDLLTLVGAPATGSATSYRLVTDSAAELPKLALAINRIATIYGFTPQQIEDFKTNY